MGPELNGATKRPANDRGQGRKPLPADQRRIGGSIRLTAAEWVKFHALGGATWLHDRIKNARMP